MLCNCYPPPGAAGEAWHCPTHSHITSTIPSTRYEQAMARIEEKLRERSVEMPNGCIEWVGGRSTRGYGYVSVLGKSMKTHRAAWQIANGPIPEGLLICHKCDNPPCINPDHLFLGTYTDNNRDKAQKGRHVSYWRLKTECAKGHPYNKENTYVDPKGYRACRTCHRARNSDPKMIAYQKARWLRRKAKAHAITESTSSIIEVTQ